MMIYVDDHLADTNILLRFSQTNDSQHERVRHAIEIIRRRGSRFFVAQQNLMEFWNVATRPPDRNGYGLTPSQADSELQKLEALFPCLPEPPEVYAEWRRLVTTYEVRGVQVHDAHLVAVMRAHGLTRLLTFNGRDLTRYSGLQVVSPSNF